MKRQPPAEPSCISRRRRRLLPLLLLLFLHLPGAELRSSFPPAPSGRGARLSWLSAVGQGKSMALPYQHMEEDANEKAEFWLAMVVSHAMIFAIYALETTHRDDVFHIFF